MNKKARLAWLPDRVIADMTAAAPVSKRKRGREALVRAFQKAKGLKVDGHPGTKTAQELYGSGLPIARNRKALRAQVGSFPWERRGTGRRIKVLSNWNAENIVRVGLCTGDHARIHRLFADEFAAIFELACDVSGYSPKSVQTFSSRTIGRTERLSLHAYGVAADFDPSRNKWGALQPDGKLSLMQQNILFPEVFEFMGWSWGGRWRKGAGDHMHVERRK